MMAIILPSGRRSRGRGRVKVMKVVPANEVTDFSESEVEILIEGLSLYEKANPLRPINPDLRERIRNM